GRRDRGGRPQRSEDAALLRERGDARRREPSMEIPLRRSAARPLEGSDAPPKRGHERDAKLLRGARLLGDRDHDDDPLRLDRRAGLRRSVALLPGEVLGAAAVATAAQADPHGRWYR